MSPRGRMKGPAGRKNPRKKPLKQPARKQKQQARNGVGKFGEQIVARLFPRLKFIGGEGADFVFKSKSGHPLFFETKTSFGKWRVNGKELKEHFLLKTRGSEWVNNKAHYMVFVTRPENFVKGVNAIFYVGKASDLRAFVKFEFERLAKPEIEIEKDAIPVLVPIKELLSRGIVRRLSTNPSEARLEFQEYMGKEHEAAMRKEQERKNYLRQYLNGPERPPKQQANYGSNPSTRAISNGRQANPVRGKRIPKE